MKKTFSDEVNQNLTSFEINICTKRYDRPTLLIAMVFIALYIGYEG